ncbi:MAG: efflux RND transporter periplasmic adaptor subunit [Gammaproteobacteria bacterium]|nr:efflux RND transporter periplasmic adaptor subunit [Gammaproteobacteria bacterium]
MLILQKKIAFLLILIGFVLFLSAFAHADIIEYDGLIEPFTVVDIGAPTEGIVEKISVDRSSRIEQGQALVELESSVERIAMEKALAMVKFDGEINFQKTQLALASRYHKRIKTLAGISTHDKDQAATDILLTKFRLKKARENHTIAMFELKKAKAVMARKLIRSPISGVVVERYVSPGEYVNSQPLLRVAQIDPLRVEVIIPARMFGYIKLGMTATIVPELTSYDEKTATVSIVDKVIDAASNTFGVRLELPNSKLKLPGGLKCLVRFEIEQAVQAEETPNWAEIAAIKVIKEKQSVIRPILID